MKYKGYIIENFGDGYTVFYEGDELYFELLHEAEDFIDSVELLDDTIERFESLEEINLFSVIGAIIEAWTKAHGYDKEASKEVTMRFFKAQKIASEYNMHY